MFSIPITKSSSKHELLSDYQQQKRDNIEGSRFVHLTQINLLFRVIAIFLLVVYGGNMIYRIILNTNETEIDSVYPNNNDNPFSLFFKVQTSRWDDEIYDIIDETYLADTDKYGQDFVKNMMKHAWRSYVKYAWGYDELAPVSKAGINRGTFSMGLTILDSLDTLLLMDMQDEFKTAQEYVAKNLTFNLPMKVCVFETTVHALGGLISAYEMTGNEIFKDKAIELGDRLLPAFNTPTGIPNDYIYLRTGESFNLELLQGDFGAVLLEFMKLTRISGNQIYAEKASSVQRRAVTTNHPHLSLYSLTSATLNRRWWSLRMDRSEAYTLGAVSNRLYEYLLNEWILSGDVDLEYKLLYNEPKRVLLSLLFDEMDDHLNFAHGKLENEIEQLMCFASGMFALESINASDRDKSGKMLKLAEKLGQTCYETYSTQDYNRCLVVGGLSPYSINMNEDETRLNLRPEVVESIFYLWRATHNPKYRAWGTKIALAIETHCKVDGGYAGVINPGIHGYHIDKQDTFFLGETLKYLHLLFSADSVLPLSEYTHKSSFIRDKILGNDIS